MSRFRYGHKPNTGTHPDAYRLLAAHKASAELAALTSPDLRSFDGPIADQGQAGSCVTFGGGRQLALYFRANGLTADWLFPDPRFSYPLARLQEWAGQDPATIPALTDSGCEPAQYLKALQACGFIVWGADPSFTYPTDEETLGDADKMAALVNARVPPEAAVRAFDQAGLQYALYQGAPQSVADWIEQCLLNRLAPTFGMVVDEAYENNTGELVTSVNVARALGSHDQCIVGMDSAGNFIVDGSWGFVAGNAGVFTLARSVINNPAICSDFQIVKAAPLPEGT